MDKKQIMKMNDTWKDFRLTESVKIFKDGAQHGFDLTDFKPGGFKKFLKAIKYTSIRKRFINRCGLVRWKKLLLEKQRCYYHHCKQSNYRSI